MRVSPCIARSLWVFYHPDWGKPSRSPVRSTAPACVAPCSVKRLVADDFGRVGLLLSLGWARQGGIFYSNDDNEGITQEYDFFGVRGLQWSRRTTQGKNCPWCLDVCVRELPGSHGGNLHHDTLDAGLRDKTKPLLFSPSVHWTVHALPWGMTLDPGLML